MSIEISSDHERIIQAAVANGHFENREQALGEALRLLREKTSERASNGRLLPPDEWVKAFTAWAESHKPQTSCAR